MSRPIRYYFATAPTFNHTHRYERELARSVGSDVEVTGEPIGDVVEAGEHAEEAAGCRGGEEDGDLLAGVVGALPRGVVAVVGCDDDEVVG